MNKKDIQKSGLKNGFVALQYGLMKSVKRPLAKQSVNINNSRTYMEKIRT